jgi:polyhydroxybutyrate depolymerase
VPLLVALHGGGGHAAFMADEARYGLIGAADRHGFIVAFPNGYSRLPGGRLATWNAGGCCGAARDQGIDDVGFIRAVVARLQERLPIDPQRIRATGMSNGGMLAHRLACEAADVFSAVAAVAGTDAMSDCRPARPVAVLHLHARDDDHVLFDGGAGAAAFRDRSQVMDFVSVPQTLERWVGRGRCEPQPRTLLQVDGARCEAWSGCAGDMPLQLCVTDTGGHSWPGADQVRRGKAGASQAIDANEVMQAFFERVPARR